MVHRVAYQLNGMSGEAHVPLYDAYLRVKDSMEDILSGGPGPFAGRPVVGFPDLGWEMEPLAGTACVCLAVFRHRLDLPAPDGFVLTPAAVHGLRAGGRQAQDVEDRVKTQARALFARLGRPCDLRVGFVPLPGAAPQADARVSQTGDLAAALRQALAGQSKDGALCVLQDIPARFQGSVDSLARAPGLPLMLRIRVRLPGEPQQEVYWLDRAAPHGLRRSELLPKPLEADLPGGRHPREVLRHGLRRGSAWLSAPKLAQLAEMAVAAERIVGGHLRLGWLIDPKGNPWVTAVEPLAPEDFEADLRENPEEAEGADAADVFQELQRATVLGSGGQTGHGGAAAGPVVRVNDATSPADVPLGAVLVAATSSPSLSRLVPRAAALLTAVGSAASHLATVAREHHVVSVFGLPGADKLEPGAMVTVDADERTVYAGVLQALSAQEAPGLPAGSQEPEFVILRRLLRVVRPLNLVDAQAADFTPEHCQSFHDIIHYAHEKSVETLLAIKPDQGAHSRLLRADAPFDIRVLDVDGGVDNPGGGELNLADIASVPFLAFLDGLLRPEVWRQTPAGLGLGEIFAGFQATAKAMREPPEFSGRNVAILGRDYMNLSLKLGYHFSVVDALVTGRPEHNLLYFRFAGGFAANDKRTLRAGFIRRVLAALGFTTDRQGDLVVGKLRGVELEQGRCVLRLLGELTAYTRQLDVELASEADVERFADDFARISAAEAWACVRREEP